MVTIQLLITLYFSHYGNGKNVPLQFFPITWRNFVGFLSTALLEEFTPLVERLGLDENFVDITEMVDLRLEQWKKSGFSKFSLCGHVFNNKSKCFMLKLGKRFKSFSKLCLHINIGQQK